MRALSRAQRSCNSSRLEPSIPPRTSNRLWGMTRSCGPIWSWRGANWDGGPPLNPTDVGSKPSSPSNANALLGEDGLLPTSVGLSGGPPSQFAPLHDQIGPQDRVIPHKRFEVLGGMEGSNREELQDLCARDSALMA